MSRNYKVFLLLLALLYIPPPQISAFSSLIDAPVSVMSSLDNIREIAFDQKENVFAMAFISNEDVYFLFSLNYGMDWSDFQKLNEQISGTVSIAIDSNQRIFVFWIEVQDNVGFLKLKRCENNCSQ